jgi:hypothetical protein
MTKIISYLKDRIKKSYSLPLSASVSFYFFIFFFTTVPSNLRIAIADQKPSPEKSLFDTDEELNISLKGDVRSVLNDRSDNPQNHPFDLLYKKDSTEIIIPVQLKTRGHYRKLKENCNYPPLLIQFGKDGPKLNSAFREQSKLKLVMPCEGDEYVIREWLVYKLYNLVTPNSFKARLVKVKLKDIKNKKSPAPFYGILLEEEKQLAKRNASTSIERKIKPRETQTDLFLKMAVFQYMIGNTDWSIEFMQNIKLLMPEGEIVPIPVPYDFDHAGIVNTSYAAPAPELQMSSIRQRRYRGYCITDMKTFDNVIALYNRLKNDIYKTYTSCSLLDAKYIKSTVQYLDEFYETINTPKKLQKEFSYPCDKNGTGNVIIKGLKD